MKALGMKVHELLFCDSVCIAAIIFRSIRLGCTIWSSRKCHQQVPLLACSMQALCMQVQLHSCHPTLIHVAGMCCGVLSDVAPTVGSVSSIIRPDASDHVCKAEAPVLHLPASQRRISAFPYHLSEGRWSHVVGKPVEQLSESAPRHWLRAASARRRLRLSSSSVPWRLMPICSKPWKEAW